MLAGGGVRLLLVNGNTTQAATELALGEARRVASRGTEIEGVTARFGAAIVSNAAHDVIAAHAVLDALARSYRGFDAAILAISLDSGLSAARRLLPMPVIGMTEAALFMACMLGDRFGMITMGRETRRLYVELAERHGVGCRLAECRTVQMASPVAGDELADRIADEARSIVAGIDVDAIIICGVALTGMARRLQSSVPVPLLDGIACGVRQAEMLVRASFPFSFRSVARPAPGMTGVSPELAALFAASQPLKEE